jgi:hypothetical protein
LIERTSELQDMSREISKSEEQREKKTGKKSLLEYSGTMGELQKL